MILSGSWNKNKRLNVKDHWCAISATGSAIKWIQTTRFKLIK